MHSNAPTNNEKDDDFAWWSCRRRIIRAGIDLKKNDGTTSSYTNS
jgi:hypothetical protein